jgi:hypothetical protein
MSPAGLPLSRSAAAFTAGRDGCHFIKQTERRTVWTLFSGS